MCVQVGLDLSAAQIIPKTTDVFSMDSFKVYAI